MPHRKTCKRFNEPGHAHFITFSRFRRQSFLSNDRAGGWLVDALDRAREKYRFHVWAYVIMAERVHLFDWPTDAAYDVGDILNSIKRSVAKRALAFVRSKARVLPARMGDRQPSGETHYRFWQRGGGYDRNIVEETTLYRLIEYLHANPVRRGLCVRPEDWRWSSAADYAGVRVGPLRLDRDSLPMIVSADEGQRLPRPRTGIGVPIWPPSPSGGV